MPSFDVVSEVDRHELGNAVDQSNREVQTRFDFKDSGATFVLEQERIVLQAKSDFQLQQMVEIVKLKCAKRKVDMGCLDVQEAQIALNSAKQFILVRQGISSDDAKKIVKAIKDSKHKVQTAIQGEQIRVTGKNRDDLQAVIALLKQGNFTLPLQFTNFRD